MRKWILAIMTVLLPSIISAQDNTFGTILSIEGTHDIDKKWSTGLELDMRTRHGLDDVERLSAGLDIDYKISPWLKASCGYTFIGDHNRRVSHYKEGDRDVVKGLAEVGDRKNRRIYWGLRHRTHISLTATWKTGNLKMSLRERWQYTFRPEMIVEGRYNYCYDKSDNAPHLYPSKARNILRSRIAAEYRISGTPATPHSAVETFNGWNLRKVRFTTGLEWKLRKGHTLDACYRYQHYTNDRGDNHYVCLSYKFKL